MLNFATHQLGKLFDDVVQTARMELPPGSSLKFLSRDPAVGFSSALFSAKKRGSILEGAESEEVVLTQYDQL